MLQSNNNNSHYNDSNNNNNKHNKVNKDDKGNHNRNDFGNNSPFKPGNNCNLNSNLLISSSITSSETNINDNIVSKKDGKNLKTVFFIDYQEWLSNIIINDISVQCKE